MKKLKTICEEKIIIGVLFCIIIFFNVSSILSYSITYDEPNHFAYGMRVLSGRFDRYGIAGENAMMPISALNAIPSFLYTNLSGKKLAEEDAIKIGRYSTVLFSLFLAMYVFKWAKELYDLKSAYFALFLYTFCPTILGHSCLVTVDLYAACLIFIATYYLWIYLRNNTIKNLIKSAIFLGIAQLSKYSSILLFPIFTFLAIFYWWRPNFSKKFNSIIISKFLKFISYIAIVILIINMGFLFNKTFCSLNEIGMQSNIFKRTAKYIGNIKLPLPYYYIQGIDKCKFQDGEQPLQAHGPVYLKGKLSARGFKEYYLCAFLWKVPLATQILFLLSLILVLLKGKRLRLKDELFLIIPPVFFFIYFSFFFNSQIGIRYILPIFPFIFVFIGKLFYIEDFYKRKLFKFAVIVLCSWLIISNLSYYPYYISYFNELIGNRLNAYKFLADSNLDWGQSWKEIARYQEKMQKLNILTKVNPDSEFDGIGIISINELVGINADPNKYRWVREKYNPIGHIGYGFLIFDFRKRKN